jgi:hypothetical protein
MVCLAHKFIYIQYTYPRLTWIADVLGPQRRCVENYMLSPAWNFISAAGFCSRESRAIRDKLKSVIVKKSLELEQ